MQIWLCVRRRSAFSQSADDEEEESNWGTPTQEIAHGIFPQLGELLTHTDAELVHACLQAIAAILDEGDSAATAASTHPSQPCVNPYVSQLCTCPGAVEGHRAAG